MTTRLRLGVLAALVCALSGCASDPIEAALERGQYEEAENLLQRRLGENVGGAEAGWLWFKHGISQARQAKDEEAKKTFYKCAEFGGSPGGSCVLHAAHLELRTGNIEAAIRNFQRAIVFANEGYNLRSFRHGAWETGEDIRAELTAVLEEKQRKEAPPRVAATPDQIPSTSTAALDLAFWESVKASNTASDFVAYLQKFPQGTFADLARARMTSLGEAPVRLTPLGAPAPGTINFGRYHALVVGINSYRQVTPLKTAVSDARMVAEILSRDYGFEVKLMIDATRNQMLDAFDDLRRTLTENDNLLIYYAGHGHLDKDSDRGFWLPVDAHRDRRANWLSNADIADMVRGTRAKHVLVVADSCYAGTLTRNLSVQLTGLDDFTRLAQKRARTALVSGGLEPVEDAGGGNHSVFAKAFLDQLRANTGVVDMSQIFTAMRRQVLLSAQQTPQYGDIRQTGHEGGDFIFVRQKPR